mmetsp:Transcript_112971/g.319511  ORF Transcript_112971/g.319511 Transcript_112971/m.319511 type:complete len:305 (-) Transcript_112971:3327-4241(-)
MTDTAEFDHVNTGLEVIVDGGCVNGEGCPVGGCDNGVRTGDVVAGASTNTCCFTSCAAFTGATCSNANRFGTGRSVVSMVFVPDLISWVCVSMASHKLLVSALLASCSSRKLAPRLFSISLRASTSFCIAALFPTSSSTSALSALKRSCSPRMVLPMVLSSSPKAAMASVTADSCSCWASWKFFNVSLCLAASFLVLASSASFSDFNWSWTLLSCSFLAAFSLTMSSCRCCPISARATCSELRISLKSDMSASRRATSPATASWSRCSRWSRDSLRVLWPSWFDRCCKNSSRNATRFCKQASRS